MAIKITQGFKITSNDPIDANLTLTKAEMKSVNEDLIPDKYLTVCQDDGQLYIYNKDNTVDDNTGKFRKIEGGSGSTTDYNVLNNQPQINNVTLINNKTSSDLHLQHEMDEITEQEIDKIIFN